MLKRFTPILLLNFVNVIGFTLLFPILPALVESYVHNSYTGIIYGGLLSTYSFCQFLGAPVLGSLSDKYGRKPILFLSQLGTTVSWIIFGAAYFIPQESSILGLNTALLIIFFSRVVDGLTGGNISVANAWVSDITTKEEKTKAFGLIGAAFGIGFLLGPAIGGLSSTGPLGFLGTAIVAFFISLITLFFIEFYLPESLKEENKDHELKIRFLDSILIQRQFKAFKGNHLVQDLLILKLFFSIVFASYTTIIALILKDTLMLSPGQIGITFSIIGFFSIFNQVFMAPRAARKIGDLHTLYFSFAVMIIGLISIPFLIDNVVEFLINAYILNMGISFGMTTFKALFTNSVSEKQQGKITGLDDSLRALGSSITPIMAGAIYALIGMYTFSIYALLMVIPSLFIYISQRKRLSKLSKL